MKYFLLLLLVGLVYSDDDYVLKTRADVGESFRKCLSIQGVSRETFKNTDWTLSSTNPLVQTTIKCVVEDFGLFDETDGFNQDRVVKQFGGESGRTKVETCITDNPIGTPTVAQSVQNVMSCLEENGLKMYEDQPARVSTSE
uniref:Odorant-binding protein 31 n=1 Tax=Bradysia odoriphaga TaxID=1564500 RepID=A0A2S0X9J2_9DIPT|nr:odorant-binding protein 31 [Bradysia odoriphaga]